MRKKKTKGQRLEPIPAPPNEKREKGRKRASDHQRKGRSPPIALSSREEGEGSSISAPHRKEKGKKNVHRPQHQNPDTRKRKKEGRGEKGKSAPKYTKKRPAERESEGASHFAAQGARTLQGKKGKGGEEGREHHPAESKHSTFLIKEGKETEKKLRAPISSRIINRKQGRVKKRGKGTL